jgi:hypothetical protein
MHLEAHLTTSDLQNALSQLTPLVITLDPHSPQRRLCIEPPSSVELRAGVGLRVVTDLLLQWDVIGVRVPVTLRRVALCLRPHMGVLDGQPALLFAVRLEDADVSALPGFLADVIVARINDALAQPEAQIAWRFSETLDFRFALPDRIQPAYNMRLFSRAGEVLVDEDYLRLVLVWELVAVTESRG